MWKKQVTHTHTDTKTTRDKGKEREKETKDKLRHIECDKKEKNAGSWFSSGCDVTREFTQLLTSM